MSCRLFHGPTAKSLALQTAGEHLLEEPYGENGLAVDDARAVVQRMLWPPVGLHRGYLIVGPVETARAKSLDVLLKSLEEHDPEKIEPLLWAHALEGIPATILSRCVPIWAPGDTDYGDLEDRAGELIHHVESGFFPGMLEVLGAVKGCESDFVLALAQVGAQQGASWPVLQTVRTLAELPNPTYLEMVLAFSRLGCFNV